MYLHLGKDTVIRDSSLIGVFDMDTSTVSKHTKAFLKKAERNKNVFVVADDIPKSFVVCGNKKDNLVYVTQIAASTIYKRLRKAKDYGFEQL